MDPRAVGSHSPLYSPVFSSNRLVIFQKLGRQVEILDAKRVTNRVLYCGPGLNSRVDLAVMCRCLLGVCGPMHIFVGKRICSLAVGAESVVLQVAIQKLKDQDI